MSHVTRYLFPYAQAESHYGMNEVKLPGCSTLNLSLFKISTHISHFGKVLRHLIPFF